MDSSIYGALVRLAQNWVMRYPLIDFHGNVGNIGGDEPAASRYTEARLAKISEDGMLEGLKKKNVDFMPNYDETTEEPVTLPAVFPNLLCNPNTGIGVAVACNWLPHNLGEVAAAIKEYLVGNEPMLPGPDFPTGGVIINKNEIPAIMRKGKGSVKVRGKYHTENNNIIFTEIPYGTSTEALMTEIGDVCDKGEIDGINSVRDESTLKGLRIVIQCDRGVNLEGIVKKLFVKTDLQTSISYNQVALVNKVPTELNLKQCIEIYVAHNLECIRREAQFDLNKAKARLEIVEGLLKALEDIDNVIALIKASDSAAVAKVALINKYNFSDTQAKAILDMKLAKLAHLEKVELEEERNELKETIEELTALISSEDKQKEELIGRLDYLVRKYGDARRTELTQLIVKSEDKIIEQVAPEEVVVVLSRTGNIKRIPLKNFKVQNKKGRGVKTLDDATLAIISTNTIDTLMLFSSEGRVFRIIVDDVPEGNNTTKGTNLNTIIKLDNNEKIIAMTSLYFKSQAKYVVFFTKDGMIKKSSIEEYCGNRKTSGIIAIKLKDGDEIANVAFINEEDVVVVTQGAYAIKFETKSIAPTARNTAGVKSIKLVDDKVIIGLPVHKNTDCLAVFTEGGIAKMTDVMEFPIQGRGGRGVICEKLTPATGKLAGAAMVSEDDTILVSGQSSSICIAATDIPKLGRNTTGNIIFKNRILSVVKL